MKAVEIRVRPKNFTPIRAIRKYCLDCCLGSPHEVRLCPAVDCPLHSRRFGRRPAEKQSLTPVQAIRARCVDCSGHNIAAPRKCEITDCYLYPFRMGKNPKRKGIGGLPRTNAVNRKYPQLSGQVREKTGYLEAGSILPMESVAAKEG